MVHGHTVAAVIVAAGASAGWDSTSWPIRWTAAQFWKRASARSIRTRP